MKKYSPTTSSRRHMTTVSFEELTKNTKPYKPLLKRLKDHAGRNSSGRITMRHQGGGNKKLYRMIDFKRDRLDIPAKVETLEYDPYRTAFIARIKYSDNKISYILAPQDLKVGNEIITSESAPLKTGNRMILKNIPVGYHVYEAEIKPGSGGKLIRSAGAYGEILAHAGGYTDIKLSSGEVRHLPWKGFATLGAVSNPEHNLTVFGKAGRSRWMGIRPTVRGSAMNPVDHPYGGGEGRTQRGIKRPKTLGCKVTGGHKTRDKKKWSNRMIIKRRVSKKKKK